LCFDLQRRYTKKEKFRLVHPRHLSFTADSRTRIHCAAEAIPQVSVKSLFNYSNLSLKLEMISKELRILLREQ